MAAQFLSGNPGAAEGLVFWAAYAATDLSAQDLAVASIYGSLDTGIPSYTSPTAVANAGPNLTTTVIEGGNHEQMGWYTGQPNDPPATIPRVDQQAQVDRGDRGAPRRDRRPGPLARRQAGQPRSPAGSRRSPPADRPIGTVAMAIPPMTRPTPSVCAADGVSPSRTRASPTVMTGWASRMTLTMTAGRRGSEIEISR